MQTLSAVELQIIRSMLVPRYGDNSPLMDQLVAARVKRRKTKVGIFVDLVLKPDAPSADQINDEISDSFVTKLPPPCDRVGFTLFVRNGYLSFLEGYTCGDVGWPDNPIEEWLLLDGKRDEAV